MICKCSHPWDTVVQAVWRKYPNPMNPAVVGIDVIDRDISNNGVMKTHRLISCEWGLPNWAQRILGTDRTCYASEHSEVDPSNKTMTLQSKNVCKNRSHLSFQWFLIFIWFQLSFCNELSIVERLTYSPHPTQPESTLLKQEAVVTVHGIPLSSYFEDFVSRNISTNANKVCLNILINWSQINWIRI